MSVSAWLIFACLDCVLSNLLHTCQIYTCSLTLYTSSFGLYPQNQQGHIDFLPIQDTQITELCSHMHAGELMWKVKGVEGECDAVHLVADLYSYPDVRRNCGDGGYKQQKWASYEGDLGSGESSVTTPHLKTPRCLLDGSVREEDDWNTGLGTSRYPSGRPGWWWPGRRSRNSMDGIKNPHFFLAFSS